MKIHDVLVSPESWMKSHGAWALSAGGAWVSWDDPQACKWTFYGAAMKCYPDVYQRSKIEKRVLEELAKRGISMQIGEWNDSPGRTHAEVLEVATALDV